MAEVNVLTLCFLAVASFVASFIDSVVGGGGLITAPALLATGIPVPYALGTGKVNVIGTAVSFYTFYKAGKIDKKILQLMPLAFIGGMMGAMTVNALPERILKYIVVTCLVVVAIYTFFHKDWGAIESKVTFTKKTVFALAAVALGMGYYDGFFGPGTGTFLIFTFLTFGFNFVNASGNSKAWNLCSNLGALCIFIWTGKVILPFAIVMGVVQILGARAGAWVAITKGTKFVRPLFLVITTLLIGKQVFDIFLK